MDTTLLILGCSIFVLLGLGHAALMLFTTKFEPRDPELLARLKAATTGITGTRNMWKVIIGFHLSHSLGLVLFGGFYITLALENHSYLKSSVAMNMGLFAVPLVYIVLAHKYWFNVPRNCCVLAISLLALSALLR